MGFRGVVCGERKSVLDQFGECACHPGYGESFGIVDDGYVVGPSGYHFEEARQITSAEGPEELDRIFILGIWVFRPEVRSDLERDRITSIEQAIWYKQR